MNTSRTLAALLALFIGSASMAWLQAAPLPQQAEPGFTPLFNGNDFTGWVYGRRANGAENKTGKGYQIENGVLYSTKEDGGNLYTEKEYANFVFRFEFRLTPNATTASASGRRSKATRHTWAWRSRCSTTAARCTRSSSRASTTARSTR